MLSSRRRRFGAGALAAALVLALLLVLSPGGGGVSPQRMQELVDSAYNTHGTTCATSTHGRDLCRVRTIRCQGVLLVAATGASNFTTVSATPERIGSAEECENH